MTIILPKNRTSLRTGHDYTGLVFINELEAIQRFQVRWPLWLFNTPLHVVHQKPTRIFTFILTDTLTQSEAYGIFHLSVEGSKGISPHRASFGSFEVAERVSHAEFSDWLGSIEDFAKQQGITQLEIKHYPHCYHPSRSNFIRRALIRNGFSIKQSLENQFIEISENTFENGLHTSERRRLRKCLAAGFRFEEWQNPSPFLLYEFIRQNRQLLGYSLSFSLEQLTTWLTLFPNDFRVFCIKDDEIIASLSLVVRVGQSILYNFCPADNLAYRTYSPAVLLNKGLYEWAKNKGITILDLGISIDSEGKTKPSLSRFKHKLGAIDSEKHLFFKVL